MAQTGLTPLMYAARAGHVLVVQELVRHGARPDLTDKAMTGWTALIHAIHKGQDAAALALLEGGAHPDARVGQGATALLYAAAYGNTAIVRALLERGAACRDLVEPLRTRTDDPSRRSQVPITSR
jgi:ankyrin repeat protein